MKRQGFVFLLTLLALVAVRGGVVNPVLQTLDASSAAPDRCRDGAYAVTSPPFGACSGFRTCEAGHFCANSVRTKCPAGTFGDSGGLRNASCSGLCAPGYYCPLASTAATANKCHKSAGAHNDTLASVYCPEGSMVPVQVPTGSYSVDISGIDDDVSQPGLERLRTAIKTCPKGWYCPGGVSSSSTSSADRGRRIRCPGGTYGEAEGLSSSACSGVCPAGFYCPSGSVAPRAKACGSEPAYYCPEGSERRQPTESGFYAVQYVAPSSSASSVASLSSAISAGGFSKSTVCPAGSFCLGGVRSPCPAGRYGAIKQSILPECDGECHEGWYCPAGSSRRQQQVCGTEPNVFCPAGVGAPRAVQPGFYTHSEFANSDSANAVPEAGEDFGGLRHTNETLCETGYYCLKDGRRYDCPAGRYGAVAGMQSPLCTAPCSPGYYCPPRSTSATVYKCGSADVFCPEGSPEPRPVQTGFYTTQGAGAYGDYNGPADVRANEMKCEPGFWCSGGVKALCRPGHYGANFLTTNMDCDGPCDEGHYCPQGSISPTEVMCGGPNRICPANSSQPIFVSAGYYSDGGIDDSRRVTQTIAPTGHYAIAGLLYVCPTGFYGAEEGMGTQSCSGPCTEEGWYCPTGSISPKMRVCGGDDRYCPKGTVAPLMVHPGYYTADYEYEGCAPGMFRANQTDWVDPNATGESQVITIAERPACAPCPEGSFKSVAGDGRWLCRACPLQSRSSTDRSECVCLELVANATLTFKHFDITTVTCVTRDVSEKALLTGEHWQPRTSKTRHEQIECEPGHFCRNGERHRCPVGRYGGLRREDRPNCQGPCAAGYYCQVSSISPYSKPCGAANQFCVEGSAVSVSVPAGYYSNEDENENTRSTMNICPKGQYCPGDGRRYDCPPGRYADAEGITNKDCTGLCARGYYCPPGSPSSEFSECGSANAYCPRGSSAPTPVTTGYYGAFSGPDAFAQALWDNKNSTYSVELLCEPGYYCQEGVKFPCPPGTFGWRFGMTSPKCGGKCAAGYYCPSYLTQQPDAPPHTQWPRKPHTDATPFPCGGVSFLCPRGSFYPVLVGGGNYTVGGDMTNSTRTGQEICLAGTYCSDGIVNLCPKGRYGSTIGASSDSCTGWCPPGHYCPPGTSEPARCPDGYYAAGASWACSACPGTRTTELACQDSRECCFRGA